MVATEEMKDLKESPGGRIGHICASDRGYMFVLGGYNGYNVSPIQRKSHAILPEPCDAILCHF